MFTSVVLTFSELKHTAVSRSRLIIHVHAPVRWSSPCRWAPLLLSSNSASQR